MVLGNQSATSTQLFSLTLTPLTDSSSLLQQKVLSIMREGRREGTETGGVKRERTTRRGKLGGDPAVLVDEKL